MRVMIGMILALLIATSPAAAADDDYGEAPCKKYIPPGTPCTCVGPILAGVAGLKLGS